MTATVNPTNGTLVRMYAKAYPTDIGEVEVIGIEGGRFRSFVVRDTNGTVHRVRPQDLSPLAPTPTED